MVVSTMAYALTLHRSCSRYLSPSRLTSCSHHTTACHSSAGNNELEAPTTSRGRQTFTKPPIVHKGLSCPNHILRKPQSSHDDMSVHYQSVKGYKISHPVLNDAKERGNYLDLKSVLRMIGTLHIDLPISFRWKETRSDKLQTMIQKKFPVKNEPVNKTDMFVPSTETTVKDNKNIIRKENIKREQIIIKAEEQVQREQHNFAEAMSQQDNSIKTYYMTESSHNVSKPISANLKPETLRTATVTQAPGALETTTNLVKQITSYIPGFSTPKQAESPQKASEVKSKKKTLVKDNVPRSVVDRKTRGLVKALRVATSYASKLVRLEELCRHLCSYPEAKTLAVMEKVVPCLLRLRSCNDASLREQAKEGLALVGYIDPVKERGIRILTLDGGGTRGLVAMEILRRLELNCKKPIHELFDYICGVSTGSLIGIMLGVYKLPLDEAEHLYKRFSREIFNRYKLMGVGKLVVSQGYYDAQLWEKILRENIGLMTFLESTRDSKIPKMAAVSTLMNMTKLSNYIFRNYTHPLGAQTLYPGSCKYRFWEAIRASSAAPMYYQEYQMDEWIHQDGGLITNNPTGIAIHEAKLLWPNDSIQCVVSLGTGRYEPSLEPEKTSTGFRNHVQKFIQSATDTEAVHTILHDLLPPSSYYRFNPYMSEDYTLDEIRPDRWDQMQLDTQLYCRKNQYKLQKASDQLLLEKMIHQKSKDWLKLKQDELH